MTRRIDTLDSARSALIAIEDLSKDPDKENDVKSRLPVGVARQDSSRSRFSGKIRQGEASFCLKARGRAKPRHAGILATSFRRRRFLPT